MKDNPYFGVGIGNYVWAFTRYRPEPLYNLRVHYAHNDYLHVAAELGVLGPIIMIWMIFTILLRGFTNAGSPLVLGLTTGALSLTLHGLVDFNFHIPANALLFIVFAGMIFSITGRDQKPATPYKGFWWQD